MNCTEPPSSSSHIVLIGKNSRGQWVVQQRDGLYGGLFMHYADAVRYALFENGQNRHAIITIGCALELDMTAAPEIAQTFSTPSPNVSQRAA